MRSWLLSLCCCAMLAPAQQPEIRTGATEVLLDLVARDKNERFVRDLTPQDIEVLEDGVPQQIRSFRLAGGRNQAAAGEPEAPAAFPVPGRAAPPASLVNAAREVNLISIVFHHMTAEGRYYAREAALQFLKSELGRNTFVAVFSLDYRLNVLQHFTNDAALLEAAVNRAASGAYSEFGRDSTGVETNLLNVERSSAEALAENITPSAEARAMPDVAKLVSNAMRDVMINILATTRYFSTYGSSLNMLQAISAMAEEHARYPGRKTVLFLSEGFVAHPEVLEVLRGTISRANRAGVSIYALDARGLQTTGTADRRSATRSPDPSREDSDIMRDIALERSRREQTSGGRLGPRDTAASASNPDVVLYALRADTQQTLAEIAEGTGGFLIANTNDFRKPFRQVMEDVRTHYELSYVPANATFDGKFRAITVRSRRPNLKLRTRAGYYALPLLLGRSLEPFELATLNALNARPLPREFEFASAAMRFRPGSQSTQHALVVEVPVRNLAVIEDAKAKQCRTRVAMTALVRDAQGQIVQKLSRDVPYSAPLDRIEELRRGNVVITLPFELAAGRYTLETAVVDRESLKAAAARSALIVPPAAELALSSITVVRRLEPSNGPREINNPFHAPDGRITPSLAGAVSGPEMMLYTVIYPPAGADGQGEVEIELERQGNVVARSAMALPAADATGAVHLTTTLPVAELAAGQYEARVTARQGQRQAVQRTVVTIERQ